MDKSLQDRIFTKACKRLVATKFDNIMRKFVGKCPTQKCLNIRCDKIRQIDAYICRKMSNTKCVNVRRDKIQQNIAWENAQIKRDTIKQSLS